MKPVHQIIITKKWPFSPEIGTVLKPDSYGYSTYPGSGRNHLSIDYSDLDTEIKGYFKKLPLDYKILKRDNKRNITAVKRADGRVFKVGDRFTNNVAQKNDKRLSWICTGFEISYWTVIILYSQAKVQNCGINAAIKIKQ